MNARFVLTIAAVCAFALGGCGSVTEGIDFHAPGAGWTATPSILGRTQIWVQNANDRVHSSVVILVRGISGTKDIFNNPGLGAQGNMRVAKDEHIRICSGQPAEHFVASGTFSSNGSKEPGVFEAIVTTVNGDRFLAMYMHPMDRPADPSAEAAIRSLCPKPA